MPAGNPKGQGPSAEARALSAATRQRRVQNHKASDLREAGWLPLRPEIVKQIRSLSASEIGDIVVGEMNRLNPQS
jgi:hypothetical protein